MTRSDANNAVLAVGLGLLAMGLAGGAGTLELPDWLPTPGPSVPDDPPGPLAAMLVDQADRHAFAQFFNDLAQLIETDSAGVLASTDQVRKAQTAASTLLVQAGRLPANATLRAELMRRQESVFGLESQPVTPELRTKLATFYRQVAEDF